jgi:hypothetical protein
MAEWGSLWGNDESGVCRDVGALYGYFRRTSYKYKNRLFYNNKINNYA